MSTLKVNKIEHTSTTDGGVSIDSSGNVTLPANTKVGTQNLPSAGPLSNRNLVINGAMQVAQRGTSVTGITNSNAYRTVDRWRMAMENATAAFTITQDTDVPAGEGFARSTKIQCTTAETSSAAGDRIIMWQGIEGFNAQSWIKGTNATQVTLSFWVKSNLTGDFSLEVNDSDNGRHTCFRYTIAAADTWQKVTWTISADSVGSAFDNDNNGSAYINFYFGAGTTYTSGSTFSGWQTLSTADRAAGLTLNLASSTSNYVNITGVQLEVGSVATPFEHRSYGDELARCQRYFELTGDIYYRTYNTASSAFRMFTPFKVSKRTSSPTVTVRTVGGDDFTGGTSGSVQISGSSYAITTIKTTAWAYTWETTTSPASTATHDIGWKLVVDNEL